MTSRRETQMGDQVIYVGLQCVIVAYPDHTHLLFGVRYRPKYMHEVLVNRLVKLVSKKCGVVN